MASTFQKRRRVSRSICSPSGLNIPRVIRDRAERRHLRGGTRRGARARISPGDSRRRAGARRDLRRRARSSPTGSLSIPQGRTRASSMSGRRIPSCAFPIAAETRKPPVPRRRSRPCRARRTLDARPRVLSRRQDAVRFDWLRQQRRRGRAAPGPGEHRRGAARRLVRRRARPRRRARLRSRRQEPSASTRPACAIVRASRSSPRTGALWCVVNERDGLGDNLPPDYATRVTEGAFYGWPWYYLGDHQDPRHKGERPDLADKRHDSRRAHPGAFGAARHRLLRGRSVSRRVQGRRLRRAAWLVESRDAHRLQGRAAS